MRSLWVGVANSQSRCVLSYQESKSTYTINNDYLLNDKAKEFHPASSLMGGRSMTSDAAVAFFCSKGSISGNLGI